MTSSSSTTQEYDDLLHATGPFSLLAERALRSHFETWERLAPSRVSKASPTSPARSFTSSALRDTLGPYLRANVLRDHGGSSCQVLSSHRFNASPAPNA